MSPQVDYEKLKIKLRSYGVDLEGDSPYGMLDIPLKEKYQGKDKKWYLDFVAFPQRGYFSGFKDLPCPVWTLYDKNTNNRDDIPIWEINKPLRESLKLHATQARGYTVVVGLEMGLLLYSVLKNPAVKRVTVVERSQVSIDRFHELHDVKSWEGFKKLEIVRRSPFTWQPEEQVDFLSVKLWERSAELVSIEMTKRVQCQVDAKELAFWGLEVQFMEWVGNQGVDLPPTHADYREYKKFLGLPLFKISDAAYPVWCFVASAQAMLGQQDEQ